MRSRSDFARAARRFRILQRDLDGVRHRADDVGREQRVGVIGAENLGDAADIGGDHRNAGRRRLDHDIGHGIAARGDDQHGTLGKAVARLDVAEEAHGLAEPEAGDLGLEVCHFLAVAAKRQRHRLAVGAQPRHRVDQEVRALDVAELADIGDVGGVVGFGDRIEFVGGDAVEDGAHEALGHADGALIGVAGKRAFEQEQVGRVHQRALEAAVDLALHRRQRVMQRAAMRGVDADGVLRGAAHANEGAGLGAMAVQHVRLQTAGQAHEMRPYQRRRAARGSRLMARRCTPSFKRGAISASACSARSPPVRLSAMMPT